MWMTGRTQECPLDHSSLLQHFRYPLIKACFIQNDLAFMNTVFCGKLDCVQLVSVFSLPVPTRRSRHTGLFHVPPGRFAIQRGLLKRLPETVNEFVSVCPDGIFPTHQPLQNSGAPLLRQKMHIQGVSEKTDISSSYGDELLRIMQNKLM